jgi:hypothetical protein
MINQVKYIWLFYLYTTLPHKLKFSYLINWSFRKSGSDYICCNEYQWFVIDDVWVYVINFLLDNVFVRFGNKVFRQLVEFQCEPIVLI